MRAVILDVDGTMYVQRPVRLAMAWRLGAATLRAPRDGVRWWRTLHAYRAAQEELRHQAGIAGAGEAQLRRAVERCGLAEPVVRACVDRWMHQEPCDLLARNRRAGLLEFLRAARSAGLPVGVFSDYPAERKLEALGVRALVDVVRSAHDAGVGRFKPAPDGLLAVAEALGVPPEACHYVGDRPEVDGVAARAAGMPAWIVGRRAPGADEHWQAFDDFHALAGRLGLR